MKVLGIELTRHVVWQLITIVLLFFGYVSFTTSLATIVVAKPELEKLHFVTPSQVGRLLAAGNIGYAIGKMVTGKFADWMNGKRLLIVAALLQAGGLSFIGSFGNGYLQMLVAWPLIRFCASAGWPAIGKVIYNWYEPAHYGKAWGMISIASRGGSFAAMFFLGLLLKFLDWRGVFFGGAVLLVAVALVNIVFLRSSPSEMKLPTPKNVAVDIAEITEDLDMLLEGDFDDSPLSLKPPREVHPLDQLNFLQFLVYCFKKPHFWYMIFVSISVTSFMEVKAFTSSLLVYRYDGMESHTAAFYASTFPLGSMTAMIIGSAIFDKLTRRGRAFLMMGGTTLTAASALSLWYLKDVPPVVVSIQLFCLGFFVAHSYYFPHSIFALEFGGERYGGFLLGALDGVGYIGSVAFDLVAGEFTDEYNWDVFFFVLSICAVILVIVMGLFMYEDVKRFGKGEPSSILL